MSRHVKSRSGCRVCKAKRLKCDETTPACRNCVNRGIACPGYRQVLRWSTKYENPVPKPAGSSTTEGNAGSSRSSAATASVPQFSQLASAASQSIKPSGTPRTTAAAAIVVAAATSPSATIAFEPAVKTETPAARRQLSQVPRAPVSSLSPASSSTSSSSAASSYGQHGPPVVPILAKTPDTIAPDPFSFSIPPTSSSSSLILTAGRQDWQLAPYGDVSIQYMNDAIEADDADEDGPFTLELWQPERFIEGRLRYHHHHNHQQLQLPHPVRGLALPGTSLVELWFKSVCGMWAAFDSPTNPFRRLCSSLWSSNEAVFFSLQTMAAASLRRRPPSVSEIVKLAPQMSTQALIHELQELFGPDAAASEGVSRSCSDGGMGDGGGDRQGGQKQKFPAGLLTSLFCMSSSLSWIDARQLGIQYLRNARSVIDLLDLRASQLSADDRELLEFFRGCLLYEEMLRSIVTDDQEDIQALLDWEPPAATGGDNAPGKRGFDLHLHAWAGVPIVLIGLFGKVMALCRRSRKVWRKTARATYQLLYQAMQDIQEGQALEEMLLSIEIPIPDEGDTLTAHIYKAAEAFRLSSLLQLYQTFPDLVSQHQQQHLQTQQTHLTGMPEGGPATGRWLMPLVLHIVDLLGEIPADSPMRCLQPLLCLCAGSALRLEDSGSGADLVGGSAVDLIWSVGRLGGAILPDFSADYSSGGLVGANTTSVHMARDALRVRLGKLEQNLPPRPITVARQLLETVWLTYDMETPPRRSHWLDIMAETNFESVFG